MTTIEEFGTSYRAAQGLADDELLRRAATGDVSGMEELTRRYQKPLYQFLLRFLDSAEDAEQATLNVFVRAWTNAPRFQYRAKVSTWLFRIAVNIARDMYAQGKRRPQTEPLSPKEDYPNAGIGNAEEEALQRIEREEQYRQLRQALRHLGEMDRLLLVLYYFEERSYEEIREITGLANTVLKVRLSRARKRLRSLLEQSARNAT